MIRSSFHKIQNRHGFILTVILGVAGFLRLYSLSHSFSYLPAEMFFVWTRNLASFSFPPSLPLQTPLYGFFLYLAEWVFFIIGHASRIFDSLLAFESKRITDPLLFLFIGKVVSVIFAIATCYIVYRIGKKIRNRTTGLIAALFLACMPLHIQESRHLGSMVAVIFFIMFSYFLLLSVPRKGLKYYLLANFVIGFAVPVKYSSLITLIPLFIAHRMTAACWREYFSRRKMKEVILGLGALLSGFICGWPSIFFEFHPFLTYVNHFWLCLSKGLPVSIQPEVNTWIDFLHILYNGSGLVFLIPFALAVVLYIRRRKTNDILLLIYPVLFYIGLGLTNNATKYYILPVFPFIAIMGADFLFSVTDYFSKIIPQKKSLPMLAVLIPAFAIMHLYQTNFYASYGYTAGTFKKFIAEYTPRDIVLLDENQQLVDMVPIMEKVTQYYHEKLHLEFKEPLMNDYTGPTVDITGELIFPEHRDEKIAISIRSTHYYRYGPPDIAVVWLDTPGKYSVSVPVNTGQVIMHAAVWERNESEKPRGVTKNIILRVQDKTIENIDLIVQEDLSQPF